ncbi:hypothetical protein NUM3379_24790 [Kineococcus sp. NUM-3379]
MNLGAAYLARTGRHRCLVPLKRARSALGTPLRTTTSAELAGAGRLSRTVVRQAWAPRLSRPAGMGAADWRAFRWGDLTRVPEEVVLDVRDATVVGAEGWAVVDGALLTDLWREPGHPTPDVARRNPGVRALAGSGAAAPRQVRLEGTVASLLLPWWENYYHWTVQGAPRHELLAEVADPAAVDAWLVPDQGSGYVREWLDLLGVPQERRISPVAGEALSCERLLVASVPGRARWVHPWIVRWLRERVPPEAVPAGGGGPRRVFLDRRASTHRRIVNREEVLDVLDGHGFTVVDPEELGVRAEASLMAGADVVAGLIGAGMANVAWCRPGSTLLELMPSNLVYGASCKLAATAGLRYRCVVGSEPALPWPLRYPDNLADVHVPVAELRRELAALG